MIEFAAPALLWGLLAIPLLRWLHRRGDDGAPVDVPALFLWPDDPGEARSPARDRPDPRWRLRALILASMLVALAGPRLPAAEPARAEVLLDDSLGLRVREGDRTRLELAVGALREGVASTPRQLTLRSLCDPERRLELDPAAPDGWTRAVEAWLVTCARPSMPPPTALATDAELWLLSDAADPEVLRIARRLPLARSIRVGRETENAAPVRLALRRSLSDPRAFVGLVRVANAGHQPVTRRLVLSAGSWRDETGLELAPGALAEYAFRLPREVAGPIRARLEPPDALREDDGLVLERAPSQLTVRVDPACPDSLATSLASHPGLALASPRPPQLDVWCSDGLPDGAGPVLALRAGETRAGEPGRRAVVQARLDPELAHADTPASLAWLDGLLARTVGREVLHPSPRATRELAAVRVAPGEAPAAAPPARGQSAATDVSGGWIVLAALLLVWDASRPTRSARRPSALLPIVWDASRSKGRHR